MTYANFLVVFLLVPILGMAGLNWRDRRAGRRLPDELRNLPAWTVIAFHVLAAVIYTTPWDNYLVASGVWYYNPALVLGVRFGWVPVEEYTFFVLQTFLAGLWLQWLARRLPPSASLPEAGLLRRNAALALAASWLLAAAVYFSAWLPFTYMGLILVWALPPILIQAAFGADLLWQRRRLVSLALISMTAYLAVIDSLAIASGIWTIAPAQSLRIYLGALPLEELAFFLATDILVIFGSLLALDRRSRQRAQTLLAVRLPTGRKVTHQE